MPSSHVLNSEKAALRQQFLAVRKRLFEEVGHKASVALARHALSVIKPEGVVAGYWPLVGEVDPRPLTEKLAAVEEIFWFQVECENFESIHNHSAYALIERDKTKEN